MRPLKSSFNPLFEIQKFIIDPETMVDELRLSILFLRFRQAGGWLAIPQAFCLSILFLRFVYTVLRRMRIGSPYSLSILFLRFRRQRQLPAQPKLQTALSILFLRFHVRSVRRPRGAGGTLFQSSF